MTNTDLQRPLTILLAISEMTAMNIIFYKSVLCPRCALAMKHLKDLCAAYPHLQVEQVEILTSPHRAWREGIRMVPALRIGEDILSGVLLTKKAIFDFVMQKSTLE